MATFTFPKQKGETLTDLRLLLLRCMLGAILVFTSQLAFATDVTGYVFCDKDGDATYDSGEGLSGISVVVRNLSTNNVIRTVTTNSNGFYDASPINNGTSVRAEVVYNGITYMATGTSVVANLNVKVTCEASCTCPDNKLINPSFENGVTGWNSSGGNFYNGTGFEVCGDKNGYLEENTDNNNARFWQDVAITPGSTASLSIWAGTHEPSLNHYIRLIFYDASNQALNTQQVEVNKDVDFGPYPRTQYYTLSGTAPANTSYVRVEGFASGDYIKVDAACLNITCPTLTNPNPSAVKTICPNTNVSFSASTTALSPVTIEWVRFNTAVANPYTATGNGKTVLGSGSISNGSASINSNNFPAVDGQVKSYYVYACLKDATDDCQPFVSYQVDVVKPVVSATGGVVKCVPANLQITAVGSPTSGITSSSYSWSGPGGFNSTSQNPSVTAAGTYTVTYSVTKGGVTCTASDTAIVSSNTTKPTIAVNGGVLTCTTTSLQLSPTTSPVNGLTYVWSGPGVPANTTTKNYTTSTAGTFTVTATNPANGCTASDTAIVSSNTTKPTVTVNGGVLTCTTTSLQLSPTTSPVNGLTYVWSGPGVPANTTTKNYTTSTAGTFTVTATNPANGCTASDTAIVSSNTTKPTVTVNGGVLTCTTTSLQLSPTTNPVNGLTYVWSGPGVPANTTTKNYTTSTAGTFTVTATDPANGCTASDTAIVSENKVKPTVSLNNIELTCAAPSQTLTATVTNASASISYAWTVPSGVTNPGNVSSFSVTAPGVYSVEVTNTINGCKGSNSTTVEGDTSKPILEISERICAINLQTYSLKVISNGTLTTVPSYTIINNGGGIFTVSGIPSGQNVVVTATSVNDCKTTLEVVAPVCNCPSVNSPIGPNQTFCQGDTATALTVTVGAGETADWYDAAVGGNKIAEGTLTYKPTTAGTYYVEARKIDASNCTSSRIALTLTIYPAPTLTLSEAPKCADNLQTYSFKVSSNGVVTSTLGQVVNNENGTFTITGVPVNQNVEVTATSTDLCKTKLTINAPDCTCPPQKCVPYTVTKRKTITTDNPIGGK
ncbi:hypothetical protein P1X15_17605 [Runella sp. MFBS21]|uniref:Ig-like domain-containing protein n=1 Tax=Runella sp. MFBS21 TaxID=3034018 RepID=UPI0023F9DDEB|nr:hypothetical protein [Runella sp. MFBS21]MDF7819438.1 hypothetical protein [Runella sp. MFBS21]